MTDEAAGDLWGLVLAGGDGVRLQGVTRALTGAPIPKQYCRIATDRSLLEATLARLAPLIPPARTLTIVNRDHLPVAADQLLVLPAPNVLVQPCNRDTGPGLMFGLPEIGRRDPVATVAVFPSDHYIRDERTFLAHVARGSELVRRFPDKIVLLGFAPTRPDTGLGYVEIGRPVAAGDDAVFHVAAFVEKPGGVMAQQIIDRGGLWNSFVMLFRVDTVTSLLRRQRPAADRAVGEDAYASLDPWNFSRDFLAHVPDALLVLRVDDVGWSDWGTPEAVERTLLSLRVRPPWQTAPAGPVAS